MHAWIALMRLSNAPTVLTNVLAGVAIGMLERLSGATPSLVSTVELLVGAVLVYSAGMVLNDAFDARVDARERPSRPIPSGRVARAHAMVAGLAMLSVGVAALGIAGHATLPWALLLGASVLLYDTLHAQIAGSWLLLGLCRALVVVIAARATSPGASWALIGWVGGGLFVYVALFSIAARDEMKALGRAGQAACLVVPVAVLAPAGLLLFDLPRANWWCQASGVAVLAVAALPTALLASARARGGKAGVRAAVGGWIGAIALMDAAVCFLADQPSLGLACVGLWGVAGALRPRIPAT